MNFSKHFINGFSLSFFLEQIILLLIVLAIFAPYELKDWKESFKVFFVFFVAFSSILGLTILEIIYLDKSIIILTLRIFVLIVCLFNFFITSTTANRRKKTYHKYRNTIAGVAGVILSFFIQNGVLGKKQIVNLKFLAENLVFNFGVLTGMLCLLIIALFIATVFLNAVGLKRKEWVTFATGGCVGIVFLLLFQ